MVLNGFNIFFSQILYKYLFSEIQDYLPTRRFVHLMNEKLPRFKSKTIRKNGIEKEGNLMNSFSYYDIPKL